MAPPRKEKQEEEGEGEQQEARGGVRAEDAPRDELAEAMARLGVGEPDGAAAAVGFRDQEPAAAAVDHFFPGFLGHRGMGPYAYPPAPQPPVGSVRGIGPAPPLRSPPAVVMPPRDGGMPGARCFSGGHHPRRGHVVGPRISEQGVAMPAPRAAGAGAARGVLPGGHPYMAPPPPPPPPQPQPSLHGGAAALNPLLVEPDLFPPWREQEVLLALSREAPETVVWYACNLMHIRHGQRLFRLVLRQCDHELREWVVATITQDKKDFWKICAQRSDEVIFMIKSCETRGSLLFLRDAMLPWMTPNMMHALLSDSNRLRVVQAFLLSSPPDIARFIFEAVAQDCTRLACQPNGLSLLQNCLERVSWEEKDTIFTEISYMSLHLAQNSCGIPRRNWIVQDVLKKGDPSHFAIIASRLRNNYIGLSRQKYSSNVVEWCLRAFNEEQRLVIVNELISYVHFRDLVTDEFANFVLSTALETCNFPLRNMLAKAILLQNVNQRNQHCTKIFSILAKSGYIQ